MKKITLSSIIPLIILAFALSAYADTQTPVSYNNQRFTQQSATPSTPAAGKCKWYFKTDAQPYFICAGGSETKAGTVALVASGAVTSNQGSISSGACSAAIDGGTATGVATTDRIVWNFNGDPTGITGFGSSASGGLFVYAYPTSNHVNFKICNNTAAAVDPGEITLNWMVIR